VTRFVILFFIWGFGFQKLIKLLLHVICSCLREGGGTCSSYGGEERRVRDLGGKPEEKVLF
jgi:hypothetical protein